MHATFNSGPSQAFHDEYKRNMYSQNGEDGIIDNDNGDVNWEEGNLDGDPYFCNAPKGNYYLRENSPCIDC